MHQNGYLKDVLIIQFKLNDSHYINVIFLALVDVRFYVSQVVNLALVGPSYEPPLNADMLIRDPLLVNNKLL